MLDYKKIFSLEPYALSQEKKDIWYFNKIKKLSLHHYRNCKEYKLITDKLFQKIDMAKKIYDLPYTHVEIFKNFNLSTKGRNNISENKVFESSGTSNSVKSKINLSRENAILQSLALKNILINFFKSKKKKIFFTESSDLIKNKDVHSAKSAGIQGFRQFAEEHEFLIDENQNLKIEVLKNFIDQNPEEEFFIFGFTSSVWQNLLEKLKAKNIFLKKNKGILIHGGGWKKLENKKISRRDFNENVKKIIGVSKSHNYYGMVEQTGSIYFECENEFFHTSIYSDIFFRDKNLNILKKDKIGLIQTLSLLPVSYPGHNILTEDIGALAGIDDCLCGRKGKYFVIKGRAPNTESRGCSDVH
jgi:phenylacetate-coenzyme A ligase PaaK-like adenylate-forming protein|tara:strand:+ start:1557 stop:2630 length:1074 start_codon:yes stop_codon:yes gene_type:complete